MLSVENKVQCEEIELGDKGDDSILTSLFGVIKRCFVHRINREVYENVAGNLVLREIFGISFNGLFLAAKGVEGLGITLNNAGQLPINKLRDSNSSNIDFSELPLEDKSQALLAQSLQSQAKKFKTMVKDLIVESVTSCKDDGDISNHMDKKRSLSNKPVMAVGVGATVVLGASSLAKLLPASTFIKVMGLSVAESLPIAPSIPNSERGIQYLREPSEKMNQID
ncbi:hypothetical protein Patl1_14632 [Pistacia atlantica]|uniref:Uncharacterized protein n=1 Tax=Pistacia atlantica TaxID=434234 RepID=A0ACC1AXD1_9ROSI|nr:hypothetical protein Patl1_14632 [Pistacia atlantica]